MLTRREFLFAAVGLTVAASANAGEFFPGRAIEIVVPAPAGAPGDAALRVIAAELTTIFRVPVIIKNVAGNGGLAGAAEVAKVDADGYTLLAGSFDTLVAASAKDAGYDPRTAFAPVALLFTGPGRSWVGIVAPAGTHKDVIDELNAAIKDALATEAVKALLSSLGAQAKVGSPREFATFIADEAKRSQ